MQEDLFVHLTNNAIQKWDANYGAFEEGNILSYKVVDNLILP